MKKGSLIDKLISLIYPNNCPYCGKIIDYNQEKCDICKEKIKISSNVREIIPGVKCVAPFLYNAEVRDAICKFKFRGCGNYSWNFSVDIVKLIKNMFNNTKFSGITYVPLSEKREKDRGYNQSERLAKEISEILDIPIFNLLEKVKDNSQQHLLKVLTERENNVKGAYRAIAKCNVQRNKLILCDDIITTGSTLKECVNVLKNAGFHDILCVAIAYAPKR